MSALKTSAGRTAHPQVGDLPIGKLPIVPQHLTMAAARKIARLKGAPCLLVERDGLLVGVLDTRALASAAECATVAASMTRVRLCLHPAMPAARARELFARARTTVLPVVVGSLLVGTVSREDLERAAARRFRAAPDASSPAAA